uniref:Secreted protein n=1 Tax=Arundo donax TaxID=35708 RepID=A0A0A8ZAR5_ARUDO
MSWIGTTTAPSVVAALSLLRPASSARNTGDRAESTHLCAAKVLVSTSNATSAHSPVASRPPRW